MIVYFFILLGAVMRVIPHPANFAPIAAIALFGGVYLDKKQAVIVPLLAMAISDFFIGFDSMQSRLMVYGSFMLIGFIGLWVKRRKNIATVMGGSLIGSVIFYLITNFAFFYSPTMYPHNWQGVIASYINALPFFRNTVLGDLFYVGVLFGVYELARYYYGYKSKSPDSRQI
ncbi:MAG: hypothetical protein A3B10_01890 [Candidatus Doudnabacteria bacterium RIFCSPLOWO2_01_FULL_44_21]|uniref:Rod shape-determining protein MreD n=1 Tax=Candidatus Doudnabacteria bacterium RIFCSPLOWO2_01_FULL_44_21 TaxID=1817841 RepID=A0A1F5Q2I4_9BACT|nr:MAG: hypothetical protein A3B95_01775 [Candidatus Doudnabacteria bacterium RIFCSPHIGHO2_02_FULL_43_13b]OGE96415.1 MAG: hypothetical protein A3B10_01890 [Candidatus Doudnabacteria bacterium RIFCSPLOWO2_01_FULL_44_21]